MRVIVACIIGFGLAAASAPAAQHSPEAQAKLDKLLAGRVPGETKHCLAVEKTNHPIGIDDSTILFRDGPRLWQSNLSGSFQCGQIDQQATIFTESSNNRLCAGDKLVFQSGSLSGACYLGEFTPYQKP